MSPNEDTSPAFQQLTADNHGPAVLVASYVFLVITLTVVFTRLVTRFQITRKFALDDHLILFSTIFLIAQTITLTFAVNNGLGRYRKDVSDAEFEVFAKATYAARVLAVPVLALAKSSVNLLIMGIHPPKPLMIAAKVTLAVTNVWAVAVLLSVIFQCTPPRVWDYQGKCTNQWALYLANAMWNITTDVVLVLLPFFLMRNVQVSSKKRWIVIGLFACRIIVPAFSIAGVVAMDRYWNAAPPDPTRYAVDGWLWTQGFINMSIITACVPCIKRFLSDLSSGMMAINISEPMELTIKNLSSSGDQNGSANRTGRSTTGFFSSKRKSNIKSQNSSNNDDEKRRKPLAPTFAPGKMSTNRTLVERSESMKGLTDGVIVQTIDYEVSHEPARNSGLWSSSQLSHTLESRPSHGSSPPLSRIEKDL